MFLQPDSNIFIITLIFNLTFAISSLLFARWTIKRAREGKDGFYSVFAWALFAYGLSFFADLLFSVGHNFFYDRISEWLAFVRLFKLVTGFYLLYRLIRLARFFDISVKDLL